MKRTDLAKNLGLKINDRMKKGGPPPRFGKDSTQPGAGGPALNPLIAGLLKKRPATEESGK